MRGSEFQYAIAHAFRLWLEPHGTVKSFDVLCTPAVRVADAGHDDEPPAGDS